MRVVCFSVLCMILTKIIGADDRSPIASDAIGCQTLDFVSEKLNRGLTALVSFSVSGTTELRHQIEQTTGKFTGSRDRIPEHRLIFKAENVGNSSVIAVKTHEIAQRLGSTDYNRAVIFVQNAERAIKDHLLRKQKLRIELIGSPIFDDYRSLLIDDTVFNVMKEYERFYESWAWYFKGEKHIVCEDVLLQNPKETLQRLVLFLSGVALSDDVYACVKERYMNETTDPIIGQEWQEVLKGVNGSYDRAKQRLEFYTQVKQSTNKS
ncbi:hypothetical protein CAPTEDRAFT_201407 [Capitella teleta]|uniref:Sulfotransferase domain-containing protein n=1 Tax=Capitella teleta TaxID=283909 RepID=R7TQ73_CAPTE|nr:hypothetical protein CAPTEDRAFT_201407 [Capitella teleta]|eukprot:ELT93185.1 hypothetical protein CAPTEDRAFT_201407 [Capitella teleta]